MGLRIACQSPCGVQHCNGPLLSSPPTHPPTHPQGAGVTNTIRSNIADLSYYTQKPDLYMYGMVSLLCRYSRAGTIAC